MNKELLKTQIKAARNEILPELVIKNVDIANVFTDEIEKADVAIHAGKFVGIGIYKGENEIDGSGLTMVPGLIDAHVHIESSMLTPSQFEKVVVPRGVTTIITDPHEIANVSGVDGISFMLADSENCTLNIQYQLPSCVPATSFEDNGATLTNEDLEAIYPHEKVLGLAEVMDFPAVLSCDDIMIEKLCNARKRGVPIDGHGAGLTAEDVSAYLTAGITTDHECVKPEEMLERVRRGMYVMLREGSAARNLHDLLKGYKKEFSNRLLFCTDDKHIDDLLVEGSIDYHVRECLKAGIDLFSVLRMSSFNTAQCYNLRNKGAIAPGYDADFILLKDISSFDIQSVWVNGKKYEETKENNEQNKEYENSVKLGEYHKGLLQLPMLSNDARVIEVIPNSIVTKSTICKVTVSDGQFISNTSEDLVKMAVIERHKGTGSVGVGIVKGFNLQNGAIATTIAHDSHNIICIGTNDEDMDAAVLELAKMGGGIAIASRGEIKATLALPVGGLMTTIPPQKLNEDYEELLVALNDLGITNKFSPLLTLSFLALPVIPSLKLTNQGLFDVDTFSFVDVCL